MLDGREGGAADGGWNGDGWGLGLPRVLMQKLLKGRFTQIIKKLFLTYGCSGTKLLVLPLISASILIEQR